MTWNMTFSLFGSLLGLTAAPHAGHAATHASHAAHAAHVSATEAGAAMAMTPGPLTNTPLDWLTNWGHYMPRTHCLTTEAGTTDWVWVATLFALTSTVIVGYLRIFFFWRKCYLQEDERDRNRKMMSLAYIFLWCAVCGYGLSLMMYFWPVYRLLAICLLILNFFTWKFAWNLNEFKVSLSARRLERELEESMRNRTEQLEREVAERTAELAARTEELERHKADLEQRNAQLAESEERQSLILETALDAVIMMDSDGCITGWNKHAEDLFGWPREEAVGRLLSDTIVPEPFREMHRKGLEKFLATGDGPVLGKRVEVPALHRNGTVFDSELAIIPLRTGDNISFSGFIRDISERKTHERELRKLSLIAEATDSAVVVTDATGVVEWVNPAFTRITGYSPEEVIGQRPGDLLQGPQTDQAVTEMMREKVAAGEGFECELANYHKNGTLYWLALEVRPVHDASGKLTQFVALERDITEQKKAAEELADALDAAEAANRAKSDFLANISHEIRTPLGAVIGFSELMLEDFQKEAAGDAASPQRLAERTAWAETVRGSGKHLLALISDVLDLSKIEAGKMEFETIQCSPHRLLGEVVSVMRVPASAKELDLSLSYFSPVPETIETDPTRLRQVVFNLVNKAVKFTERGNVRLLAGFDESGAEPQLVIHVADTGIGMNDSAMGRLFDPFTQADTSVTRRFGGTGLGLCISKYITEQLGGGVSVKSEVGVGSTFTVRVSVGNIEGVNRISELAGEAASDVPVANPIAPEHFPVIQSAKINGPLTGRTVLVVDDGVTNRQLIGLLLRREGVHVVEATDGGKAVAMIADGLEPDVVLMDMQMPVLDGYSATRLLRERGCTIPIVALTAHAMSGDRDRCLSAGCDNYLTKPINRDDLLATVMHPRKEEIALALSEPSYHAEPETKPEAAEETLTSSLPMDDADFAQIAAEFVDRAAERLPELFAAAEAADAAELASLAHWLRGVSGSAGYGKIQAAAEHLEQQALRAKQDDELAAVLDGVRGQLESLSGLVQAARRGLPRSNAAFQI